MAIASAPSTTTTSFLKWAGRGTVGADADTYTHTGHPMQHVGTVNVTPNSNTTVPLGGFFDLWYCLQDHNLLIDTISTQVGGPV